MDKQQFIDTHLTDYLKQFPDATDAELDDITSSSARTFDSQQKPQEYSAIPTIDTTKGFAENIAKDAPVLLGKVAEGGGDFAATAMQGTKKAVETLLSPFDTEAEAEAKRQATDVAYGSIKNALGEGVRNIQKYYQDEAPEFEPSAGVQVKSELYPADYAERFAKAKEKQGQTKPEVPGLFEQIPGGREVRESIKAIPQFVGQSAADVGSLAGNLYEGDPETVQQFYEKPLTTAGMPALGVAIPLSLGYRKTIGKETEEKPAPAELTPEEAQYKAKFDAELQKAQLENTTETKAPIAERPMNTEQNFEDALAADIYKKQPQLNPKVQEEIANAGVQPLEDMRGVDKPNLAIKASVLDEYGGPLEDTRGLQVPKTDGVIESPQYLRELEARRLMEVDLAKEAEARAIQQTELQRMFAKTTKEAKANKKTNAQDNALMKKRNVEEGLISPEQQQGGWLAQLMDEAKQNGLQTKQEVQGLAISKGRKISRETAQSILTDIKTENELGLETQQKPINKLFQKSKEFLGNEEGTLKIGPIVDSLTSGYEAARQKLFEARKKMSELGNPIDNALTYFFEKYHPILKTLKGEEKVKGLETIDQKRNADNFIKQFLKDSGLAESVAKDLSGAGLNLDHLGAYAEARRTLYERDPRGIASRLDKQKAIDSLNEYNPKQQAALQKAFSDIQSEWQKTIIPNLIGSEVFDPKINSYISKNDNYSRNVVVEKALESVLQQGDAHSQKLMQHLSEFGSKKEILNPIEQMILYARTLNQFTSREVMKRNLVDMVAKNGEVFDVPKDGYAPVKYQHNGEWVEKYLPKDMAYALNEHPIETSTAGKFFDWLAFGNPVSKAMTRQIILNPAFIVGNSLMLDPITTWAQLPSWQSKLGYPLVHILTLAEKAGSTKAGQLAKYFGIDDLKATQEKMTKNKVYNIGSLYDRSMSGETQLEGIMEGIGLNQNVVEFFTGKKSKIAKAAGAFENMASKIDNSSKESLYRYLNAFEGYRGQEKINQMTREMGTPATKRSGEGEALLRRGTMFGNAVLQAGRATAKNFVDNPVQFAFSNIGVPTALAYGAYQWMKSDPEMKKRWDSLSEYQKKNFINIYTGEGKEGKPLFFSLPLPRMARIAYGVMIDLMETDKTFAEHAGNVVKGLAQGAFSELPGALSQPLNLAGDVISYARGKAPYDYYRGQEVIPQKVMDADETLYNKIFGDKKMNNLSTDKAFASYLLNTYATGGWFKLDSMKNVPEGFEWTKIAPMNRIFRMGGSGVSSKLYKAKDEGKKLEARASLIIEDAVKKSVKDKTNLEITPKLQEAIQFLPNALKNQMIKASIKNIKDETGDPNIDLITALQGATTMQKMLIIKKFQEMFPNSK